MFLSAKSRLELRNIQLMSAKPKNPAKKIKYGDFSFFQKTFDIKAVITPPMLPNIIKNIIKIFISINVVSTKLAKGKITNKRRVNKLRYIINRRNINKTYYSHLKYNLTLNKYLENPKILGILLQTIKNNIYKRLIGIKSKASRESKR